VIGSRPVGSPQCQNLTVQLLVDLLLSLNSSDVYQSNQFTNSPVIEVEVQTATGAYRLGKERNTCIKQYKRRVLMMASTRNRRSRRIRSKHHFTSGIQSPTEPTTSSSLPLRQDILDTVVVNSLNRDGEERRPRGNIATSRMSLHAFRVFLLKSVQIKARFCFLVILIPYLLDQVLTR